MVTLSLLRSLFAMKYLGTKVVKRSSWLVAGNYAVTLLAVDMLLSDLCYERLENFVLLDEIGTKQQVRAKTRHDDECFDETLTSNVESQRDFEVTPHRLAVDQLQTPCSQMQLESKSQQLQC